MKDRFKPLLHPCYGAAVLLLLFNDHYLKHTMPGIISGKISDFAGLFAISVFIAVLFDTKSKNPYYFTGLFFIFWKSDLSDIFISRWNNLFTVFPVSRVSDLTDLSALLVLPLAWIFTSREHIRYLPISPVIPFLISAFAFAATSYSSDEKLHEIIVISQPKEELNDYFAEKEEVRPGVNKFTIQPVDTLEFFVQDTLICSSGFYVRFLARSTNTDKTELRFLSAAYQCKRSGEYLERIRIRIHEVFK